MSTSRSTRTRAKTIYPSAASSEEDLSDVENTPRTITKQRDQIQSPSKSHRKKHHGDATVPLKDISSDTINYTPLNESRMPLRTVSLNDINDDLAEKRRRRKSNKILAQPSMEEVDAVMPSAPSPGNDKARAVPASSQPTQNNADTLRARPSIGNITAVEEAPLVQVPLDVMSSNFEEWMKLATDNKINPTNSWNFALIDYFHDMSLLRNVTDNSINFQKASCTLDGCVKIWTSRVDSVGTETFKLVSNLASEGNAENLEDPSDQAHDPQKKRNNTGKHRTESTLAKSAAQLRTKKLELEFMVDPLFKKTCADFDESGAQGLLMNHLNLGLGAGCLRVVFDAGDCVAASGENEEGDDADQHEAEEPEDLIDLSYLRREFLPSLDTFETKAISQSLEGFSFERGAFDFTDITVLDTNLALDSDGEDNDAGIADNMMMEDLRDDNEGLILPEGDTEPVSHVEDFFVGDQAVEDDYSGDNYGDPGVSAPAYPNQNGATGAAPYEPFDPRRVPNERNLVMAMTGEMEGGGDSGGMMDYFDQNFLKNWAGPEHWKVKRTVRRPLDAVDSNAGEAAGPKTRREKKDKDANKIDFSKPLDISVKELFTPLNARTGGGKKAKEKEKQRSDQMLPDDMHFSSRQLVTLFLKPKFSLKMRGHRVRINEGDGEVDERFWAQAAADQAQAQLDAQDETVDGGAIPFNTQFFHDDYEDGGGYEDVFEGEGRSGVDASVDPEEQNLLAATEGQSRRIRPEFVSYAKRAKRVDVRKLKENIWKGLSDVIEVLPEENEISAQQRDEDEEGDVEMEIADDTRMSSRAAKSQPDGRVFESVITRLKESYPPDKMSEISTSFCFICLLHLANEEGLRVQVDGSKGEDFTDEVVNEERGVGNLWNLQVFKDPNAVLTG